MAHVIYAHNIRFGLCPNKECRSAHIFFCDKNDEVIAIGTVAPSDMPVAIKELQDIAYTAAAMKEG